MCHLSNDSLPPPRVLAISTSYLLCPSSFLARLVLDSAHRLGDCALDLVFEMWLSLLMSGWSKGLLDACARLRGSSSSRVLARSCALTLCSGLGRDSAEDARTRVACCAASLYHFWVC